MGRVQGYSFDPGIGCHRCSGNQGIGCHSYPFGYEFVKSVVEGFMRNENGNPLLGIQNEQVSFL